MVCLGFEPGLQEGSADESTELWWPPKCLIMFALLPTG